MQGEEKIDSRMPSRFLSPRLVSHKDYQMCRRMLLGHIIGAVKWAAGHIGPEMRRRF